LLDEISEAYLDLAATGFSDDELHFLLDALSSEVEDLDAAPPLSVSPVTRRDDLWVLGPRRYGADDCGRHADD
jgi:hypothetical protein